MNFEEKLESQFIRLTISSPSVAKYITHIYADYVELNALFLKDEVTKADISDKLRDVNDANIREAAEKELDNINVPEEIASLSTEKDDTIEDIIHEMFEICQDRQTLFKEDEYPFMVQNNYIKLKEDLTDKHKLYILLLLCSNLNYFNIIRHELTVDFEVLSYHGLRSFLPLKAVVREFGKNSFYKGSAQEKILSLAKDLGIEINKRKFDDISPKNFQERGLDLIAWYPFSDNIPNMIVILAQCACGKEWDDKQGDTKRFQGYMHFDDISLIHMMFIPYAIGSMDKKKFHQCDIIHNNRLIFDRKRILEQLGDFAFLQQLTSLLAIEKIISKRIDL